jgi:hypothetical protein
MFHVKQAGGDASAPRKCRKLAGGDAGTPRGSPLTKMFHVKQAGGDAGAPRRFLPAKCFT